MVQKFNQVGVACVCADSMNTAIRQTLNVPQDVPISIPDEWFEANSKCAKLLPWWGAKADYSNYDAKAHYDSLVWLRQVSADIVEHYLCTFLHICVHFCIFALVFKRCAARFALK